MLVLTPDQPSVSLALSTCNGTRSRKILVSTATICAKVPGGAKNGALFLVEKKIHFAEWTTVIYAAGEFNDEVS